jgi:hypothetical protein
LTKTVKPKLETHCYLEQRGRGAGVEVLPLNYLGKRKERLRVGEKRVSRLNA